MPNLGRALGGARATLVGGRRALALIKADHGSLVKFLGAFPQLFAVHAMTNEGGEGADEGERGGSWATRQGAGRDFAITFAPGLTRRRGAASHSAAGVEPAPSLSPEARHRSDDSDWADSEPDSPELHS